MTHGSLFSGIGGFDLASEWMGWENLFHCERNEFAQKVLHHYWPKAQTYEDITETDFTIWRGRIDLITGGFPCQPFSQAGLQLGTEDDRHLWPEMLRCIQEVQPRWVVGENVLGLLNWNDGMVFDQVQTDLESAGYSVQAYVLPAASVNAPHKRLRIFFVGYSDRGGRQEYGFSTGGQMSEDNPEGERSTTYPDNSRADITVRTDRDREEKNKGRKGQSQSEFRQDGGDGFTPDPGHAEPQGREESSSDNDRCCKEGFKEGNKPTSRISDGDATDSEGVGYGRREGIGSEEGGERILPGESEGGEMGSKTQGRSGEWDAANSPGTRRKRKGKQSEPTTQSRALHSSDSWGNFPTQSPLCDGDDGLSSRLDGITFPKWRNESIKAGGNAIVPQVALQIFKAIEKWEQNHVNPTQNSPRN